jgi:hypothetical protein
MESKYLITCLCASLMMSCGHQKNDLSVKTTDTVYVSKCDLIIYELPEKASKSLLSKIEGKKVSFCNLSGNAEDNYSFAFSYDDEALYSKRDTLLLQRTNVYLKLGDKYYPIVTDFDYTFSNIPRTDGFINDFNFCFITVNARGEVLDGFAY